MRPLSRTLAATALGLFLLPGACSGNGSAAPGSLSPSAWSPQDRARYGLARPEPVPISGTFHHHAIAGTTGPAAVHIGERILEAGGTAADAVIATSLAQIALSGGSWNSCAGIFMMVYYDASTRTVHSLNGGYNTVLGETDPKTIPAMGTASGRTAFVPGYIAGIDAAHRRFGRLPFASLVQPTIDLAENGVPLSATMQAIIDQRKDVLSRRPDTLAIFTRPDGKLYRAGDLFRQPRLAETLRAVAHQGAAYIYSGPWAEHLVQAIASEGGKLTMEDMRRYQPAWSEPLRTTFEGFEVCTIGHPEIGGVQLIEALNLYQAAGAKALGPPNDSPQSLFRLMQIARFGYLPSFLHPLPAPGNPADPFAPANRITMDHARRNAPLLDDPGFEMKIAVQLSAAGALAPPAAHSDSIVAVDRYGNFAAVTHTSNNITWGTTGIFVDGISIPDSAAFQQDRVALVHPGDRFPNATNCAIVLKDGTPFLGSGAIGSGLHEAALQNLINILAFGMDPESSLDAPMFLTPDWASFTQVAQGRRPQNVTAGEYSRQLLDAVRALGQPVAELDRAQGIGQEGYWVGIQIDPADHSLKAAISPKLVVAGAAEGR